MTAQRSKVDKKLCDTNLGKYVSKVVNGQQVFENAAQSITRMIIEGGFKKINVAGQSTYDFGVFRQGSKHIIGMHDTINSFVTFVRDAAEGGSSKEMAFVLVGEPGNGKTFFVEYVCQKYREFLAKSGNGKNTFKFVGIDNLKGYGRTEEIISQTYEDPMILTMNLLPDIEANKELLLKMGATEKQVEKFYENHRPLGACSGYIWRSVVEHCEGKVEVALNKHIEPIEVPLTESMGTITGKYPAKDKITSSSVDLLGEESIQRLLDITDSRNPYKFDLNRGALSRVAGGGIHFSDEIYKNKKDLVQVYLGVSQNRCIETDGYKWPIDTFIIATSNNSEFNRFISEAEEAPIVDRCRVVYVSHNTNFKLQKDLTSYAIGSGAKTTVSQAKLHEDPNLNYACSVGVVLTRLPHHEKLTPEEMMKLAAGEVAGEKNVKTLTEIIKSLREDIDVTKRFGQTGLGHRSLGRALQLLIESSGTNEGECMFAYDVFEALEYVVLDYVSDSALRIKFQNDIKLAKTIYRSRIETAMFNAYMDEPDAIRRDVMSYVNMVIGRDSDKIGPDNMWAYTDPQTKKKKAIKIDEKFINSVENALGLKTDEQKDTFRTTIIKLYSQRISTEPNYDFMDNLKLVKAVTDVRLKSDIAGAGSLVGALSNRTNEENQKLHDRMIKTMINKLFYCKTCALKTIEYFCGEEDVV